MGKEKEYNELALSMAKAAIEDCPALVDQIGYGDILKAFTTAVEVGEHGELDDEIFILTSTGNLKGVSEAIEKYI